MIGNLIPLLFSTNSRIPAYEKALVYLDGSIHYNGTNYYFVDKKNGFNFLITNFDFEIGNGFPYKSAATVSAPASNTILIAADINNFLYDSGGTPNQLPVISLFQNIDYENKLFCKHVAQVVDSNGVETSEPFIKDIVLYNDALTGADLVNAISYYGVPAVAAAAKWVDPVNGVDATGDGSKALPWKTLTKAEADSTDGDTIYVKTGLCNETNYWYPRKHFNWKAIGLNVTRSTGTTYVVLSNLPEGHSISGFTFDSENNTTTAIYNYSYGIYEKCKAINPKTGTSYLINVFAGTPVFNNCIFIGSGASGAISPKTDITISGSIINCLISTLVTQAKTLNFLNNKIIVNAPSTSYWINCNIDSNILIKGCNIEHVTGKSLISTTFTQSETSVCNILYSNIVTRAAISRGLIELNDGSFFELNLKYNVITMEGTGASPLYRLFSSTNVNVEANTIKTNTSSQVLESNRATGAINIINNSIVDYFSQYGLLYDVSGAIAYTIQNNYIECNGTGSPINIRSGSATHKNITIINNNTLVSTAGGGYGISVGAEITTVSDNTYDNIIITNNKLLCERYFTPGAGTQTHGIFVGFQATNIVIKNNYVSGAGIGIVTKGSNSDYSNCIISYNIVTKSNLYGIYFKGTENNKAYGNTLVENNLEFYFTDNTGSDGAINQTIKNNILYNTSGYLYKFDLDSYSGHSIDYNVIFGTDKIVFDGTDDIDLAEWNTVGYDTHSEIGNPLLIDFIPDNNSPAIGAGVDLGTDYDDGLDASTDWGTDSELPVIVTKQQGEAWDCGAYIH